MFSETRYTLKGDLHLDEFLAGEEAAQETVRRLGDCLYVDPQLDRPRCWPQWIDGFEFGPLIGRPDVAHEPPGRLSGRDGDVHPTMVGNRCDKQSSVAGLLRHLVR
jgi:hypothetical protein